MDELHEIFRKYIKQRKHKSGKFGSGNMEGTGTGKLIFHIIL